MASYHLSVKIFSRSSGRSGVAAAAYRARTQIYDERQGLSFDYSKKGKLVHSEIIAPENAPQWVYDRARLWNTVEASEKRTQQNQLRQLIMKKRWGQVGFATSEVPESEEGTG